MEEEDSTVKPSSPTISESSSSSEDDDVASDNDDISDAQLEELEAHIAASPTNYEAHKQYIAALRSRGLLEKLRSAREAMNLLFPLSPDMWLEWTRDEARLVGSTQDISVVQALFECGVQEYMSVPLWLEYLKFKECNDDDIVALSSSGVAKMKALYERALTAAGLHFSEGGKIWKAYIEFEQALLLKSTDAEVNVKSKQIELIRSLFRRRLSIPLSDSSEAFKVYKEWEIQQGTYIGDDLDGLPSHVASGFNKAFEMCKDREVLEEKIARGPPTDTAILQHFLTYISMEEATGDPARAQVLYERAIVGFPVTEDLWLRYTRYLGMNLKVSSIIKSTYARAVRNCPWVQALWNGYLLALERFDASDQEISEVFDKSLQSGFGFSSPNEYLEHFLTRADGLRRRMASITDESEKKVSLSAIREVFDRASQFMTAYFPDFIDRSLKLYSYWAYLEAYVAMDVVAARGVWETLLKTSGWMVEAWQRYISMEIALGNFKEARSLYKRCYSRRLEGNGTEMICESWVRFEREHCSLEDYERALMKVEPRLAEVKLLQQHQSQQPGAKVVSATSKDTVRSKPTKQFVSDIAPPQNKGSVKTRGNKPADSCSDLNTKKRGADQVSATSLERAEKKAKIETSDGNDDAQQYQTKDGAPHDSQQEHISTLEVNPNRGTSRKKAVYTDECTVFVSNIPLQATEDDVRKFFSSCGGLKEVRLLKNRSDGRSRGLAYVDFENEECLERAVEKNRLRLMDRRLSIARSNPTLARKANAAKDEGNESVGQVEQETKTNPEDKKNSPRKDEWQRGQPGSSMHRRGGHVQLTGKNTFATPRAVRPLGFISKDPKPADEAPEVPQSNDAFRKLLLKK